ncbi:notchless homolog [Olea europaea subsp. europaea]|uniref:Notchless homolog n=1 Tax=Olea europaea subsp. europaea TaxID=158383 RepID=A0A8S0S0K4_OLEEU|nr:notchless homolog [Olea europaea subsp. europaea]
MEVEAVGVEEETETNNIVMCQFTDPEGVPLGLLSYLPQSAAPRSVLTIVFQRQAVFRICPVTRCSSTITASVHFSVDVILCTIFLVLMITCYGFVIAGHTEAILSVAFSSDGRQLASGSGHKNCVLYIAWSPDVKHLVSGSKAGELQCWDPQIGKASGNPLTDPEKWITGISRGPLHLNAPCHRFVSPSKNGDARIWDQIHLFNQDILSNAYFSSYKLRSSKCLWKKEIYTISQDCTSKMWETSQGKLICELKGHGHSVNSLALSTEYFLRTGAYDHTCKQYSSPEDMKKSSSSSFRKVQKMKGNAPKRLVSGSDDFTMFLWEPLCQQKPQNSFDRSSTGRQSCSFHLMGNGLQVPPLTSQSSYGMVLQESL